MVLNSRALMRIGAASAVALALGGCALLSSPPTPDTFDLSAPDLVSKRAASRGILVVQEPTAIQVVDSQRMVARSAGGEVSYVPDAQWSDRLPALFQARLIESFENAGRLGAVARPGDSVTADYQLLTDLRTFEIDARTSPPQARVEVAVRIISNEGGRIVAGHIFSASAPAQGVTGPAASASLNEALKQVLSEIVRWTGSRV